MKIVLVEPLGLEGIELEKALEPLWERGHHVHVCDSVPFDDEALWSRCKDAEVLIMANHPLPNAIIHRLTHLKMISVAFTGVDHLGIESCKERGITVSNASGYATEATAEMALMLILGSLRRAQECHQHVLGGRTREGLLGRELLGKTVGILGTGAIGLRLAELLLPFGCNILGTSRSEDPHALELGVSYVPLQKLLEQSHILSVHLPLTPGTKGLIDEEEIASMRPGSILVNVARGPIVNYQALADALHSGHLGAAGIDVFETEPPLGKAHPLHDAPRVFLSPHVGFYTREALQLRARIVVDNILAWEDGAPQNRVV